MISGIAAPTPLRRGLEINSTDKLLHKQSPDNSGNSNSPVGGVGVNRSSGKIVGSKPTQEGTVDILIRRKHRLSTISSDFFDEVTESPRTSIR